MSSRIRFLLALMFLSLALAAAHLAVGERAEEMPPPRARLVNLEAGEERGRHMSVIKVLELVGSSSSGWDEAVRSAVQEATRKVSQVVAVEVTNWTANVDRGHIAEYKANVKVAYQDQGPSGSAGRGAR